jgi:hypothetical protein
MCAYSKTPPTIPEVPMTPADALLVRSATQGSVAGMATALKQGANIHAEDKYGPDAALRMAASRGHPQCMLFALENGASIHAGDKWGPDVALRWAARERHLDCMEVALAHGADVHAPNKGGPEGVLRECLARKFPEGVALAMKHGAVEPALPTSQTVAHSAPTSVPRSSGSYLPDNEHIKHPVAVCLKEDLMRIWDSLAEQPGPAWDYLRDVLSSVRKEFELHPGKPGKALFNVAKAAHWNWVLDRDTSPEDFSGRSHQYRATKAAFNMVWKYSTAFGHRGNAKLQESTNHELEHLSESELKHAHKVLQRFEPKPD